MGQQKSQSPCVSFRAATEAPWDHPPAAAAEEDGRSAGEGDPGPRSSAPSGAPATLASHQHNFQCRVQPCLVTILFYWYQFPAKIQVFGHCRHTGGVIPVPPTPWKWIDFFSVTVAASSDHCSPCERHELDVLLILGHLAKNSSITQKEVIISHYQSMLLCTNE